MWLVKDYPVTYCYYDGHQQCYVFECIHLDMTGWWHRCKAYVKEGDDPYPYLALITKMVLESMQNYDATYKEIFGVKIL